MSSNSCVITVKKCFYKKNIIAVLKNKVIAFTTDIKDDEEPITVLDLTAGETVNDITSIGNTLIISSTKSLYYILFKNKEYVFLGNKVPFPYINFTPIYDKQESFSVFTMAGDDSEEHNWNTVILPEETEWNQPFDKEEPEDRRKYQVLLDKVWSKIEELKKEHSQQNRLTSVAVVRYAVNLLDSKLSSIPVLLSPHNDSYDLNLEAEKVFGEIIKESDGETSDSTQAVEMWSGGISVKGTLNPYQISMKLNWDINEFTDWADIIDSISIYVSVFDKNPANKTISRISNRKAELSEKREEDIDGWLWRETQSGISSATLYLGDKHDYQYYLDDLLASTANTYLVKRIKVYNEGQATISDEINNLIDGEILDIRNFIDQLSENFTQLETQERLSGDDLKHYLQTSEKISSYNNQLLLTQPSNIIAYDYNRLNAYDAKTNEDSSQHYDIWRKYDITYLLKGVKNDKVVKAGPFLYEERVEGGIKETIHQFQIFPDSRAYKMQVKVELYQDSLDDLIAVKYAELDMLPHPYLNCAYFYGDLNETLHALCTLDDVNSYNINAIDDIENKLLVSKINNPFTFPVEHRYTFQSKVLGVAIANTALSQGQFGQFPLYVFTEDGIWAMETGADGSFITNKPLSRDVCVNPDSITSIDNAVVFVTEQGVMMLQGSQVVNISPNMNGRHYTVENVARTIIEGQKDFKDLLPVLSDSTHFMAFVKKASIAYDYAGKRLIFFKEDEAYQYIYKLDTNTWHKMALASFDLIQPINSYPECLVRGKHTETHTYLVCLGNNSAYGAESLRQMVADFFPYDLSIDEFEDFLEGKINLPLDGMYQSSIDEIVTLLEVESVNTSVEVAQDDYTSIYDLTTALDLSLEQQTANGVIVTRPFDLGHPDVFKAITDIRVRGQYRKEAVKFILLGSNDGFNFHVLNALRGKSWKLFRLIILADLQPTERISWIDVQYETRFTNRLR